MKIAAALLSTLLLAAPGFSQQQAGERKTDQEFKPVFYTVGNVIPESMQLVDMDGKKRTFKDFRGKIVVLSWYSMNCPYMVRGYAGEKKLTDIQSSFAIPKDWDINKTKPAEVVVIAINSNHTEFKDAKSPGLDKKGKPIPTFATLRTHLTKNKVQYPVYIDQGNVLADLFKAKTTPHCFVIDENGKVRYDGAIDDNPKGNKKAKEINNFVYDAVAAVRNGQPVARPKTKPYGCSVKRIAKAKERRR